MSASTPAVITRVFDPQALRPGARGALIDALYTAHCAVFDGVSRAEFEAYVINSAAQQTRIQVLYDADGHVRGYCALHAFVQQHLGRPTLIVRAEIGVEARWRRQSLAAPFIARTLTKFRLRYLALPAYFFACFVHPSAYVSLCRHTPEIWPRPDRETPIEVRALMQSLARQFELDAQDGVAQVGWIARGCSAPKRVDPLAEFYLARNPGYVDGQGLITVLPLGSASLARGIANWARHRRQRRRRGPARPARLRSRGTEPRTAAR